METEFPGLERLVGLLPADSVHIDTSTQELLWQIASSEPVLVLMGMLVTVGTTFAIHAYDQKRAKCAQAAELFETVKSIVHDIRYLTERYHAVHRRWQPPVWGFGPTSIFQRIPVLTGFADTPPRPGSACFNLLSEAGAPNLTARILTLHRCSERICAVMRRVEHFSNAADAASDSETSLRHLDNARNFSRQAYTRLQKWGPQADELAAEFNKLMRKKYRSFGLRTPLLIADDEGRDAAIVISEQGEKAGDVRFQGRSKYYQDPDFKDEQKRLPFE